MNKIYMKKHKQELASGKWCTVETESRYIDEVTFDLITNNSTVAFFKALGGSERIVRSNGKIIRLISTNPDKTKRSVYEFKHS